jgi:WS/DGAT/MGAT family acyltransferase
MVDAWGQLSPHDAAYVYFAGAATDSTVLSCSVIAANDGRPLGITAADAREYILPRLTASDMFKARMVRLPGDIGMPYWTRHDHLDVDDHIKVHNPGITWSSAQQMLSSIADAPVLTDRPLWSLDVLPDVVDHPDRDGVVTMVALRLHHAAIDGISMAAVIAAVCHDDIPTDTIHHLLPARERTQLSHLVNAIVHAPLTWLRFLAALGRTVYSRPRATHSVPLKDWPATRFNTGFTGPRATTTYEMDLDEVRAMKRSVPGATVNTVLLSVIGDAVTRYLTEHGERPQTLSALAPMSTRAVVGGREAPTSGSNQFTPLVIDLSIDEPDPIRRLRLITDTSDREKKRAALSTSSDSAPLLELAPAALLRLLGWLTHRQASRRARKPPPTRATANIIVSNVYNPNPSRTIFGHQIVSGFGIQPLTHLSTLAHAASTRNGIISISITADRSVMPDIDRYKQLLHTTFTEHQAALRTVDEDPTVRQPSARGDASWESSTAQETSA